MNKAGLKRLSAALGLLAVIACPIMVRTIDLPAAIYARNDLSKPVVQVARLADNIDDCISTAFVLLALFAWFKLRNKDLFRKLLLPPVSSLVAGTLTNILKPLFGRWRPKDYFNLNEYGFDFFSPIKDIHNSFPSGHSSSIMAIMTAMALLFPRWRIPFLAFACGMGSIRVIVGAHYPADVVGGLILGYLSTRWFHYLLVRKNVLDAEPRITYGDWQPGTAFTQK